MKKVIDNLKIAIVVPFSLVPSVKVRSSFCEILEEWRKEDTSSGTCFTCSVLSGELGSPGRLHVTHPELVFVKPLVVAHFSLAPQRELGFLNTCHYCEFLILHASVTEEGRNSSPGHGSPRDQRFSSFLGAPQWWPRGFAVILCSSLYNSFIVELRGLPVKLSEDSCDFGGH